MDIQTADAGQLLLRLEAGGRYIRSALQSTVADVCRVHGLAISNPRGVGIIRGLPGGCTDGSPFYLETGAHDGLLGGAHFSIRNPNRHRNFSDCDCLLKIREKSSRAEPKRSRFEPIGPILPSIRVIETPY
jgi:hypothetical protein